MAAQNARPPAAFNAAASLQLDRLIILMEANALRSDLHLLRLAKAALEAEHVPATAKAVRHG
jgi:hypothetical protein